MVKCDNCGKDVATFYDKNGKKLCIRCYADDLDLGKEENKRMKRIKKDYDVLSHDIFQDIDSKLYRIDKNLNFITLYLKIVIILGVIGGLIILILLLV